MYCLSCGNSIPDESKFCLYCGKSTTSSPKLLFSDLPPQHMVKVSWTRDAPYVKTYGVRTGIRFCFQLLDEALKPTRSDGKAIIHMNEQIFHTFGGPTYPTVWKADFNIQMSEFRELTTSNQTWGGYIHNIKEAVLSENPHSLYIEIWFQTPDGQKIYGTDHV